MKCNTSLDNNQSRCGRRRASSASALSAPSMKLFALLAILSVGDAFKAPNSKVIKELLSLRGGQGSSIEPSSNGIGEIEQSPNGAQPQFLGEDAKPPPRANASTFELKQLNERVITSRSKLLARIRASLVHHASAAAEHSAYMGAIAARSGLTLWRSRDVVAALLVRGRLAFFTSELGESFRPMIALWQVQLAYAVSWMCVLLDVLLRTCDELALRGRTFRVLRTLLFFSIFHTIVTMLLPATFIHCAVHQAEVVLHRMLPVASPTAAAAAAPAAGAVAAAFATDAAGFAADAAGAAGFVVGPTAAAGAASAASAAGVSAASAAVAASIDYRALVRTWTPSLVGLALVPLMPLLDEPCEKALAALFHRLWPLPQKKTRRPSALTDYEVSLERSGESVEKGGEQGGTPLPPPLHRSKPPPESHEEPELLRATGKGEPDLTSLRNATKAEEEAAVRASG